MNSIPSIVNGEVFCDIFSAMLKSRSIYLEGEINSQIAASINAQLLYLDSIGDEDIEMHIDSPGGSISAGMAILDTMNYIKADVATICSGTAASMAAVIFAGGAKGKRYILPHSEVMIHQPSTGFEISKASDIKIIADHIAAKKRELINVLSENSGQPREQVEKDIESDHYMNAEEAVKYGIADKILTSTTGKHSV
jgi:ATP-dependent Clp protease protease subunit